MPPKPICSADYDRVVKTADLGEADRALLDDAFDMYVERWQHLRDDEIRPLQKEFASEEESGADLNFGPEFPPDIAFEDMTEAQRRQAQDAIQRRFDECEAKARTRLKRKRDVFRKIEALDGDLLEAIRIGLPHPEESIALETLRRERVRRMAVSRLQTSDQHNRYYANPLCIQLPGAMNTLSPEEKSMMQARLERLDSEMLPILKLAGEQSMMGDTCAANVERGIRLLTQTIRDIESQLSGEPGRQWAEQARETMIGQLFETTQTIPKGFIVELIGDRMSEALRQRLERWDKDRRTLQDEILKKPLEEMGDAALWNALEELDTAMLSDVADATNAPELKDDATLDSMYEFSYEDSAVVESSDIEGDPEANDFMGVFEERLSRRRAIRAGWTLQDDDDDADEVILDSSPGLRQHDVEWIRVQLVIPPDGGDLWQSLADDALDESQKLHDRLFAAGRDGVDLAPPVPDADPVSVYLREQEVIERRWFEQIATAFRDIPPERLQDILDQRLLHVLRETQTNSAMVLSTASGELLLSIDTNALMTRCSHETQASMQSAMLKLRQRMIEQMREICGIVSIARGLYAQVRRDAPEPMDDEAQAQQTDLEAEIEARRDQCQKRIDAHLATLLNELEAIAQELPPNDASRFRRALREQAYPEIHVAIRQVEDKVSQALALPNLSHERRKSIEYEVRCFRDRSEELANLAENAVRAAEKFHATPLLDSSDSIDCETPESSEKRILDLTYDLEELNARILRRLRAQLTSEQAAAVGL